MKYRFTFRRIPKCDVVVVQPHRQTAILRALHDISFLSFDAQDRRIALRPHFLFLLLRNLRSGSRLAAWLAATVQASRARVVIGMDNFDLSQHAKDGRTLYEELGERLKNVKVLSVQHGQELRRFSVGKSKKNVTLLCWGNWVAENFPIYGRGEAKYVPVGALVDGLYRAERPEHIVKDVEICFVSTVKDESWWGSQISERRAGYEALVKFLRTFQDVHGIIPHIALASSRDQNVDHDQNDVEKNWFIERLGPEISFSGPKPLFRVEKSFAGAHPRTEHTYERYSTYFLCDRSKITLGMSSSVLWESFGRGNKILAVNLTDNPIYDFPISGIWALRQPTYSQFEARLKALIAMPDDQWNRESHEASRSLIAYNPNFPPHVTINREVKRWLLSSS